MQVMIVTVRSQHLPTHHFLNIDNSCLLQDPYRIQKLLYFLSICILFTIYKGRNQPVIEYISESNERKNLTALTLWYKPSRAHSKHS